ncbi:hypothetical protein ACVB8X_43130 [Streptomyces sp. NRAIS4]
MRTARRGGPQPSRLEALAAAEPLMLLLMLLAVRVGRVDGRESTALHLATAGVGRAGKGSEPLQVLGCPHPCRRVGRTALQMLLGHRSLLMDVDSCGPLRRSESGVPARVVDTVRRASRRSWWWP